MDLKLLNKVQTQPRIWIEKVLGCATMEAYQANICDVVAKRDQVGISACHAVGKTWLLARIVLWFLYCHKGSIVITTAPTSRQVEKLLWGEIGSAVQDAPYNLGGHLTSKELKLDKKWYAMGFSPQKTAGGDESNEQQGSTFQGWHSDYVLIVFDEAVGIPPDIWIQVEGLLTSGKIVKFVCIANPTTKNCDFYDKMQSPTWTKVHLSCFDSRNLPANGINTVEDIEAEVEILQNLPEDQRLDRLSNYKKVVTHLISCRWVMEKAMEWGITDARFKSKVLGQFPDVDDTVLIQSGDVKLAQARKTLADENDTKYIGIDVARFGDDKSVWTVMSGTVHTRTVKTGKKDLMETVGKTVKIINEEDNGGPMVVAIDATGVGAGVYDRLVELRKEPDSPIPRRVRILEIHFGAGIKSIQKGKKATKKELLEQKSFLNIKALMFDDLRDALKNTIRLKNDSTYLTQLPTIKYTFTSADKMQIESKKDYKKRTGKPSPDESDSLALANFARRFADYAAALRKLVT